MSNNIAPTAFMHKVRIAGNDILPVMYLNQVDEPEFGCEERPESEPVYGVIYGCDAEGDFRIEVPELLLYSGIDDSTWVGRRNGIPVIWRDGSERVREIPEKVFEELQERRKNSYDQEK